VLGVERTDGHPQPALAHDVGQGLLGVRDEVEEHLLKLMIVGPDVRDVGSHLGLDRHPGQPEIGGADVQHLLEQPAKVHALALQRTLAAKREKTLHDTTRSIDRPLHHGQVRLHRRRRLVAQQLQTSLQHR